MTLGAPSRTTEAYDYCLTRWKTAGVWINQFHANGRMREAAHAAMTHFDCGPPEHPPNMLPRFAATLDCTIDGMPAEVFLLREGDHVSANIHPRP